MLGKISGAAAIWAGYRAKTAQTLSNGTKSTDATQSADDQSPAAQALQRSKEALNTLKQANASQKQQRKGAAKAKVDRLKKELENLRLWGGDPKAVARRAAQISRELASAAKEYASSGGRAGLGLADAGGAGDAQGATGAQDAEQAAGEAEASSDAAMAEAQAGQAGTPEPVTAHDALVEQYRQDAAEAQKKGAEGEEDSKFAAEVRRLHAQAKAVIAEQKRRAEREGTGEDEVDRLVKQIDADAADIQQAFSDGAMAAVVVPVVLQV